MKSATPSVSIEAEDTENGNAHIQPLRECTAALLAEHLRLKLPSALAFDMPATDCGANAVRRYLVLTGNQKLGVTPHPYMDEVRRVFDFHALRGQFATSLARNGVSLAAARELMRHSTVELTAKHYTHLSLEDRREAIKKLPEIVVSNNKAVRKVAGLEGESEGNSSENFCHICAKILPNYAD